MARKRVESRDNADATPDVTFHKQMTEGKRLLASKSPLSRLLPGVGSKRARSDGGDAGDVADASKRARVVADRDTLRAVRKERKREKKAAAAAAAEDDGNALESGVVYVGHVPHGFYEDQMRAFFDQFGTVTRLRVSRSRKTARSKGYAFVEFANAEVARIAAEAMDGYLMFKHALVAKVIDKSAVHPKMFDGADRKFRPIPWAAVEQKRNLDSARNPDKLAKRTQAAKKSLGQRVARLTSLGISYKFPVIQSEGSDHTSDGAEPSPDAGAKAVDSKPTAGIANKLEKGIDKTRRARKSSANTHVLKASGISKSARNPRKQSKSKH